MTTLQTTKAHNRAVMIAAINKSRSPSKTSRKAKATAAKKASATPAFDAAKASATPAFDAAKPNTTPVKRAETKSTNPAPADATATIKLLKDNPHRKGSKDHARFAALKDGLTV